MTENGQQRARGNALGSVSVVRDSREGCAGEKEASG